MQEENPKISLWASRRCRSSRDNIKNKKAGKFAEVVTIRPPPAPPKKPDEKKPKEKKPPEKKPEAKKPEEMKLEEKVPVHPYNNHMPNLSTNGCGSYESVGGTRFQLYDHVKVS
ncbi:hypothetical protein Tco_0674005 [Tanacetum coccineum]